MHIKIVNTFKFNNSILTLPNYEDANRNPTLARTVSQQKRSAKVPP